MTPWAWARGCAGRGTEEIGIGGRRWRCGRERAARAEQIGERPPVVMRTGGTGSGGADRWRSSGGGDEEIDDMAVIGDADGRDPRGRSRSVREARRGRWGGDRSYRDAEEIGRGEARTTDDRPAAAAARGGDGGASEGREGAVIVRLGGDGWGGDPYNAEFAGERVWGRWE